MNNLIICANVFLIIAILTLVVVCIGKVIHKIIFASKVDVDLRSKDVQHEHDVIKRDFTAKPVKF